VSIFQLINDIDAGEIVLPAIQRDFVWDEERIYLLFDSILRGYPVGIALLWETYEPIQYRKFSRDHVPGEIHEFLDNNRGKRLRLVLDGQQRLSSLFVALRGTFDHKRLYFDILSGSASDDHSEQKYLFSFTNRSIANQRNADYASGKSKSYWLLLSEIVGQHPAEIIKIRNEISEKLDLSPEDRLRLEINFSVLQYSLAENGEIIKTQTIDDKLPANDQRRKSAFDVLEIFVRVNTQGVVLRRSDLIVSMLRLYWQEASTLLPKFLQEVNRGNSLAIDNDFVIRCMFAVAGLGTRLDFELLRKKSNVDAIRSTYERCFSAVRSAVDFARNECQIDSPRLIGGISTLVPFVYYLARTNGANFPRNSKASAKQSLILFALSKTFTQHSESRTGAFIRDYLTNLDATSRFPYDLCVEYVYSKTSFGAFDHRLISNNVDLSLSVIQRLSGGRVHHAGNLPEIDHIFPQSILRDKEVDEQDINDIGNLWILPRNMNRNKSAKAPKVFLEEVDEKILQAAGIDRNSLVYGSFKPFVRRRRDWMLEQIGKATGLDDTVFAALRQEYE